MTPCDECANNENELRKVKESLRKLEESQAEGYEYAQEHAKLERRRAELLAQLSAHQH